MSTKTESGLRTKSAPVKPPPPSKKQVAISDHGGSGNYIFQSCTGNVPAIVAVTVVARSEREAIAAAYLAADAFCEWAKAKLT